MTIVTVAFAVVVWVVAILSSSGTVKWWFLRNVRNPTGTVLRGREAAARRQSGGPLARA